MARKKLKSPDIQGFTYEVTQLGATAGLRMFTDLTKILAPALSALVGSVDPAKGMKAALSRTVDGKLLEQAAKALAAGMDTPKVQAIVAELAETTEVWGPGFGDAGAPLGRHFDEHFAGRYGALLRWLWFALQANFGGDFFVGLTQLGAGTAASPAPAGPPSGSRST